MNKSLLSLKKTILALMLIALSPAGMAQGNRYISVAVRSLTTGLPLLSKMVKAERTFPPDSTSTQYQQNNSNGVAQFTVQYSNPNASLNLWKVSTGWVGQTPVYDTVTFTQMITQQAVTLYLPDSIPSTVNCNPAITVTQVMGTNLWRIKADTSNYRQCFGWGYGFWGLVVDGVQVDSNVVLPGGGITDGNSGSNASVFQTPLSQGVHNICVVISAPQSMNSGQTCMTVTVGVNPQQNFITGLVKADGPLYQGTTFVELFGLSQGQLITRTDTLQWPQDSGTYYFGNVPQGQYFVRATPIDYNYISTYHQSSLTWEGASLINMPGLTMPPYILHNIDLISLWDSSWVVTGVVQGLISGIGTIVTNNLPGGGTISTPFTAGRANVLVLDAQGRPVAHTTLNPDGTFYMDELPVGNYSIVIDHPFVDAASRPASFSVSNPIVSVQATVTSTGLNMITGNKMALRNAGIILFPNPAQSIVSIQNFDKIDELSLINVLGKSTKIKPMASLNLEKYTPGIYFLKGNTTTGESFNIRLIKQ